MKIIQETENLFRLTRFGIMNCFLVCEPEAFRQHPEAQPPARS